MKVWVLTKIVYSDYEPNPTEFTWGVYESEQLANLDITNEKNTEWAVRGYELQFAPLRAVQQ